MRFLAVLDSLPSFAQRPLGIGQRRDPWPQPFKRTLFLCQALDLRLQLVGSLLLLFGLLELLFRLGYLTLQTVASILTGFCLADTFVEIRFSIRQLSRFLRAAQPFSVIIYRFSLFLELANPLLRI